MAFMDVNNCRIIYFEPDPFGRSVYARNGNKKLCHCQGITKEVHACLLNVMNLQSIPSVDPGRHIHLEIIRACAEHAMQILDHKSTTR